MLLLFLSRKVRYFNTRLLNKVIGLSENGKQLSDRHDIPSIAINTDQIIREMEGIHFGESAG